MGTGVAPCVFELPFELLPGATVVLPLFPIALSLGARVAVAARGEEGYQQERNRDSLQKGSFHGPPPIEI